MTTEMAGTGPAVVRSEPQQAITDAQARVEPRLFYIDNLRVGLITLVIVGHIAITYGAPLGNWYYREEGAVGPLYTILTTLLLGIGASFLLGLFYMIAGYFTPRPVDRKGAGTFLIDRLKRLGIPLAFYALLINPLVTYWVDVSKGFEGTFLQFISSNLPDLTTAAVGPLWFVEGLLIFSIVYALGRLLTGSRTDTVLGVRLPAPVPGNRLIALFALGIGLATFIVRIWAPMGWWWEPIHLEPGHFPQYIALFAVGILAYRHDWFARLSTRQVRIWGWVALACIPLLPVLAVAAGALRDEFDPAIAGGFTWLSAAYSFWEGFIGVAMLVVLLPWCRERFNQQGWLLRRMASSAYTVYVLHPLLIVPLALSLRGIQLLLSLKFVLVAPLAVALCFLVGYLLRKLPLVKAVL